MCVWTCTTRQGFSEDNDHMFKLFNDELNIVLTELCYIFILLFTNVIVDLIMVDSFVVFGRQPWHTTFQQGLLPL